MCRDRPECDRSQGKTKGSVETVRQRANDDELTHVQFKYSSTIGIIPLPHEVKTLTLMLSIHNTSPSASVLSSTRGGAHISLCVSLHPDHISLFASFNLLPLPWAPSAQSITRPPSPALRHPSVSPSLILLRATPTLSSSEVLSTTGCHSGRRRGDLAGVSPLRAHLSSERCSPVDAMTTTHSRRLYLMLIDIAVWLALNTRLD